MTTRDNYSGQSVVNGLSAIVLTADQNGLDIDTQGYDSCLITVNVGASGDTLSGSVFAELEIETAPDDGTGSAGTYVDATDAEVIGSITGTNTGTFALIDDPAEDEAVYACGVITDDRFVRCVVSLTGTHSVGTEFSVTAVLGHGHRTRTN